MLYLKEFQLTTSRRGRRMNWTQCTLCRRSFNSRPHEEVDQERWILQTFGKEFQLTTSRRGRHNRLDSGRSRSHVSTHDLTKRSTKRTGRVRLTRSCFNSRPHEEVDAYIIGEGLTDAAFQLTTSRRGRHGGHGRR